MSMTQALIERAMGDYVRYLRAIGRRPDTIRVRTYYINRLLRELDASPWLVSTAQIEDWLAAQRWGPGTRRSAIISLRSFFAWAASKPQRADNPARLIPAPREPRPCPRAIPPEVLRAAMDTADDFTRALLRLLATTGLRRGEAAKVHSDDVEGDWLRVTGKGGVTRRVPLPPDVRDWLVSRRGYAFPGRFGGCVHREWITRHVKQATGYPPHALRHLYATRAYAASHDLRAVQRLLGHATVATTQRYVESGDAEASAAASATWVA